MRDQKFHTLELKNGITVLAEEIDFVSSAAFSLLVPVGAALDPEGQDGAANVLAEMLEKGAGDWNAQQLSQQFEDIGVQRSHSVGVEVSIFSGAALGENIGSVLELVSTVLQKPKLPAEELEPVRQLALQDLRSLEDEPSSKVMVELGKQLYPYPFGRSQLGTVEGLTALTTDGLAAFYRERYRPGHAILAVAGAIKWADVVNAAEHYFGGWKGDSELLAETQLGKESQNIHIEQDTNQLQIALAYPSVSMAHPDYYAARVAVGVLSGGMSGRLFIEVREKRGLVYRVSASHSGPKGRAAVLGYAGTTPDNGQQCLDVMLAEFRRLKEGVADDELRRAKADLKSRLIIQGESTSSRASSLVSDWWSLKKPRTLSEIGQAIDAVTSEDIIRHVSEFPPNPVTLVTLGPKKLELNE